MEGPPPIELLDSAASRFADLLPELVFLGGAVVALLMTEKGGLPPRVTRDVDVAIEVSGGYASLVELDRRLLRLGFRNDINGPTSQYVHGSLVVDVIPVNVGLLGEVNNWYPLAIETAKVHVLPSGIHINVIEPACFLGTKLVAFRSPTREFHDDIHLSRDFGDIIRVIDGRPEIAIEVREGRADLRAYLQDEFSKLVHVNYLSEAISEHVDPGREKLVIERIRAFLG